MRLVVTSDVEWKGKKRERSGQEEIGASGKSRIRVKKKRRGKSRREVEKMKKLRNREKGDRVTESERRDREERSWWGLWRLRAIREQELQDGDWREHLSKCRAPCLMEPAACFAFFEGRKVPSPNALYLRSGPPVGLISGLAIGGEVLLWFGEGGRVDNLVQ
jgi:hypothetical protein